MDIICREVAYTYHPRSPFEKQVLEHVNLHVHQGSWTFVVGQTGSGKSTLVQMFNGLLQPTQGEVQIGDLVLTAKNKKAGKSLYQKIGMAFQYPEHQLFAETVEEDIAFGPSNLNWPEKLIGKRVSQALETVGLTDDFLSRSPFSLSGGEKRKVALAGVLSMQPETMILDEPTAGLDPFSKHHLLQQMAAWKAEDERRTIITVSHQMDDVADYADDVVVLDRGQVKWQTDPVTLFLKHGRQLQQLGLDVPPTLKLWERFCEHLDQAIACGISADSFAKYRQLSSVREADILQAMMHICSQANAISSGSSSVPTPIDSVWEAMKKGDADE